jgi:hypothetical protein
MIAVREYASAEENMRHAQEVRARMFGGPAQVRAPAARLARPTLDASTRPAVEPPVEIPDFLALKRDRKTYQPKDDGFWRVRDLLDMAAVTGGVSVNDIMSGRQSPECVRPRQVFCWLAKQFTLLSYPQIGTQIGYRNHTTIMHACRRVDGVAAIVGSPPQSDPNSWAVHLLAAEWPRCNVRRLR